VSPNLTQNLELCILKRNGMQKTNQGGRPKTLFQAEMALPFFTN